MSRFRIRPIAAIALITLLSIVNQAQQTKPNPDEKPRKVKPELKTAYKEWIDTVGIILTQSERDTWTKLKTDDEREAFIKIVWDSRDPDPDTEENEFKDQFYAHGSMSSGLPRGRSRLFQRAGQDQGQEKAE